MLLRPRNDDPIQLYWLVSATLPPVPLDPGHVLRIGRKATCDFVIKDDRVSRQHAEVFYKNGALWIRDLGSHNGTKVDGERIEGIASLREGAKVEFDTHAFWVKDSPVLAEEDLTTHCGAVTQTSFEAHETSLSGDLAKLDLPSVLKALDASAQTGQLELVLADGRGARVALRVGRPVAASFAGSRGEAAFALLLAAARAGTFSFVNKPPAGPPEFKRSLTALLAGAARVDGKAS